jgi:hypothetical protein
MISMEAIKRKFDELWVSRIKQMREEAVHAGLGGVMSEALVLAVQAHSSIFMNTASRMPAHLKDAYAMLAIGLLREVTGIPDDLKDRTLESARKICDRVHKHREQEDSEMERAGLSLDEQKDLLVHMDTMAEWLINLMAGMGDESRELFLKMCRDQLEVLVKLHDEATAN